MSWQRMLFTAVVFTTALMSRYTTTQQCGVNTFSIYQKMLRGHTFKTFKAWPGSSDCGQACNADIRCKSYNFVIFKDICELNNRTKEDRPDDFVHNKDRYYMKASKRVSDFCIAHQCQNNGTCVNSNVNYTCACMSAWWTGRYCEKAVIPPAVGCVSLTKSEATNSYEVNAVRDKPPDFCRVLPEQEINAGDPYTMTVELLNVNGSLGVNVGHPGLMYNVIDENNFDLIYFRPHYVGKCCHLGYVLNGIRVSKVDVSCSHCPPKGGVWFTARVVVSSDKSVSIYLNDDLVKSLKAQFSTKGRGGVLTQNGYQNIIQFRKFKIIKRQ